MQPETLPGLERLLEVCRRKGIAVKQEAPVSPALAAGALVAGQPLDPVLAAVHARLGYCWVKEEFFLFRRNGGQRFDLGRVNERWRQVRPEPFGSLFVFAEEDRLGYLYATVPRLADSRGRQPVVKLDVYEAPYALPVASDVDRFFDTYARYLEAVRPERGEAEGMPPSFPWAVPELLARDGPLVALLEAGRFDRLLPPEAVQAREWCGRLLAVAAQKMKSK
jgi:hypothetical protein